MSEMETVGQQVRKTRPTPHALWRRLEEVATQAGIDAIGVTSAEPLTQAAAEIEQVKLAGLHAGMHFTFSNPARSTQPALILPGARSVIVGARSYGHVANQLTPTSILPTSTVPVSTVSASPVPTNTAPTGHASTNTAAIANYAVEDQYGPLAEALEQVAEQLRLEGEQASVVLDDNRLVDRAVAYRAGLGWFGRNTMLLHPKLGSWTVLGAVVTTAVLPIANQVVSDGCGTCHRCEVACPTDALSSGPDERATLDANRCLAWLLQADGVFPREFRVALGDRLYGCDDCQTTCPINEPINAPTNTHTKAQLEIGAPTDATNWSKQRGETALSVRGRKTVDPAKLLLQSDDRLMASFGHWYIPRRRPEYLRRNALLVLANTADATAPNTISALRISLSNPSSIVRSHAVWAAARLGHVQLIHEALADDSEAGLAGDDPEGIVAEELAALGISLPEPDKVS